MFKEKRIKIYPLHVGDFCSEASIEVIDNTLEAKQKFVGGTIQGICIDKERKLDIVCNDDGKLLGLPINRGWILNNELVDFIAGEAFICRHDKAGNYCSIREEDLEFIFSMFKPIFAIIQGNFFLINPDGSVDVRRMKE